MTSSPTALTRSVDDALARLQGSPPTPDRLERQLRLLAKWRSIVLANTLTARGETVVRSGPFAGMIYTVEASEGCRAPRLLGAYEASLHPVIETVMARAYPQVLDIGCAEGYYAVGLARRMPATTVHARDSDPKARDLCATLATANGVSGRLRVGAEVWHSDFALCARERTFILCDIEGGEATLLNPAEAPAQAEADILVEVHEAVHPGLLDTLTTRFAPSHRVTRIDRSLAPDLLPPWAETLSDLDRLLLLWEWRSAPTPWLWMERR
ncbi:MAG: class I SAM-dependent methyltransferase [Acetobacteraceae bacterium]|nr:MAG: class I SAM-dependent methyltransferase [Acetobacteraceae bacterium]